MDEKEDAVSFVTVQDIYKYLDDGYLSSSFLYDVATNRQKLSDFDKGRMAGAIELADEIKFNGGVK